MEIGVEVKRGDVLARIPRNNYEKGHHRGSTSCCKLFEARKPKTPAIISEVDGFVRLGKETKLKKIQSLSNDFDDGSKLFGVLLSHLVETSSLQTVSWFALVQF